MATQVISQVQKVNVNEIEDWKFYTATQAQLFTKLRKLIPEAEDRKDLRFVLFKTGHTRVINEYEYSVFKVSSIKMKDSPKQLIPELHTLYIPKNRDLIPSNGNVIFITGLMEVALKDETRGMATVFGKYITAPERCVDAGYLELLTKRLNLSTAAPASEFM